MHTFVKKSFLLSAAAATAALIALSDGTARAHEAQPRSENFRVENDVHISSHQIKVFQTQTYKKEFLDKLWNKVDTDKDGRFSKEERDALEENLKGYYADHTALRVNWQIVIPLQVGIWEVSGIPSRRPKNTEKAKPAKVTFFVTHDFKPSGLDLVDLVIPSLNAHEVSATVHLEKGLRAVRVNTGRIREEGRVVWDMLQTDGHPDAFSLVVIKEQD